MVARWVYVATHRGKSALVPQDCHGNGIRFKSCIQRNDPVGHFPFMRQTSQVKGVNSPRCKKRFYFIYYLIF